MSDEAVFLKMVMGGWWLDWASGERRGGALEIGNCDGR